MTMSDRIAVINEGSLQQIDPPLVCYNEPANMFVAGFIGSPAMNFFDGTITEDGWAHANGYFDVEFDPAQAGVSAGDEVTLGIRPEDVYLQKNVADVTNPTALIETQTDVLEPMGDEIFVYLLLSQDIEGAELEAADAEMLMSVEPDEDVAEDEPREVALDREKIHLFDTASGEAIHHGFAGAAPSGGAAGAEAESDD